MAMDTPILIGRGSCGLVHRLLKDGKQYVRKTAYEEKEYCLENEHKVLTNLQDIKGVPRLATNVKTDKYGRKFFIMENIENAKSLERFVNLSNSEIGEIVKQVLDIVDKAHRKGFSHRDIKKENILYERESGLVYLIDWGHGLSKEIEVPRYVSYPYGSPFANPPEFYEPFDRDTDWFKVDVWQIAVLLYELTTSSEAFPGNDEEMVKKITTLQWDRDKFDKVSSNQKHKIILESSFLPRDRRISLDQMTTMMGSYRAAEQIRNSI